VRVYLTTQAGKETTLNLLGSGTVLWARRLEPTGGHAVHARVVGPSVLAFLGRGDLERLVLNKPEVGLRMMDLLAERLAESNERMAEVARKEVLSRLAGQVLRLLEGRGGGGPQGRPKAADRLHPRGAGHDGWGQPGDGDPRLGRLQDEGAVELKRRRHPREGPGSPTAHRQAGTLARRQNPAFPPGCVGGPSPKFAATSWTNVAHATSGTDAPSPPLHLVAHRC
jgi:CRP/FNR family transcriptional regulator